MSGDLRVNAFTKTDLASVYADHSCDHVRPHQSRSKFSGFSPLRIQSREWAMMMEIRSIRDNLYEAIGLGHHLYNHCLIWFLLTQKIVLSYPLHLNQTAVLWGPRISQMETRAQSQRRHHRSCVSPQESKGVNLEEGLGSPLVTVILPVLTTMCVSGWLAWLCHEITPTLLSSI